MTNGECSKIGGNWKHWTIYYGYNYRYTMSYPSGSNKLIQLYPDISKPAIYTKPKKYGNFLMIDVYKKENKNFSLGIAFDI